MSQMLKAVTVVVSVAALLGLMMGHADQGQAVSAGEPDKADASKTTKPNVREAAEKRISAILNETTSVELIDTPLSDALAFLADQHKIAIRMEAEALGEEGIASDEPINLALAGVTLRSALNLMLQPLGLTYITRDEVLMVTTQIAADARLETRVYDVRALCDDEAAQETLARVIRRTIRPQSWIVEATSLTISASGKTVVLKRGNSTIEAWDVETGRKRNIQQDSGNNAAVEALPGRLVISQSQRGHYEIAELLRKLEITIQK